MNRVLTNGLRKLVGSWVITCLAGCSPAWAVLFYGTGDTNHNTTPPTGPLANSGWQWQGSWQSYYLGTPVAPRYFLGAKHVGGGTNQPFVLGGRTYLTVARYDDASTDLSLYRVAGVFPSYAPLGRAIHEEGRMLMVFGRGTTRGEPVIITNEIQGLLRGWRWGPGDGRLRWGQNVVDSVLDGGSGVGDLLVATFDQDDLAEECHLSIGDSGGAAFMADDGAWRLVGIHYSVSGPYSFSGLEEDPGFNAALFDETDLFVMDQGWTLVPPSPNGQAKPGAVYTTRVSARLGWINGILQQPLPDWERIVLESAGAPEGPFGVDASAVVDETNRTVKTTAQAGPRFYRVRASFAARLGPVRLEGADVVIPFE